MTLGQKLKEIRKKIGLSQEQLAEIINVSRQAITKWETDAGLPDTENLKELSRIFEISIDYLLEMTSIPDKIDDYIKKDVTERVIQQPKLNLSSNEQSLIMKFRKLPTRIQDKIEAHIEAEYDIVMETEQTRSKNA